MASSSTLGRTLTTRHIGVLTPLENRTRAGLLFTFGARGKRSGREAGQIRTSGAQLFHVRGGKVRRLVQYFDRENAFADLGLASETDSSRS
jgi:hypothetical protein